MEDRKMTQEEMMKASAEEKNRQYVNSASDARTVNNTAGDPMRSNYRVLSEIEKEQMLKLKAMGQHFLELCDKIGSSRELSIAKTKTEEAVMWAVKHVTR